MSDDFKLPLVAVVTPVYNGASFLSETMACVQAQTYDNLVHFVLDNASTDETPAIIEHFKNCRVPVIAQRNSETIGVKDNWETAIRSSPQQATYFLLLCADDLITPDAIEKMVALAERDPSVGVVGCLWTTGSTPGHTAENSRCGLPADISIFNGRWFVKSYLMQLHYATSPQCQMFRRSVIEETHQFYSNEEMLMDVDACLATCTRWNYGFIHSRVGFTRVHGGSITGRLMQPNKMHDANWLALIDRFGPIVMSPSEFSECRGAFLRYYFRRLLLWRYQDRNKVLFDMHIAFLKERGVSPTVFDYVGALFEWVWLALLNRRNEVSTARSLWANTWAELRRSASDEARGLRSAAD
jgi:glycosyltransferase involved in cell wall biosynthesis